VRGPGEIPAADRSLLESLAGNDGRTRGNRGGPRHAALIRHVAVLESLGDVEVKGRSEPVHAYRLRGLNE
jgi:class 3 adenylate cyclase